MLKASSASSENEACAPRAGFKHASVVDFYFLGYSKENPQTLEGRLLMQIPYLHQQLRLLTLPNRQAVVLSNLLRVDNLMSIVGETLRHILNRFAIVNRNL